jgi:putative membrane protein
LKVYHIHIVEVLVNNKPEVIKLGEKIHRRSSLLGTLIRFVVNAIVLMVVSYFVPNFAIHTIWAALLAAIVISILDYAIQVIFKIDASPIGRGLSGFIVAVVIIYLTKFIVPGFSVTWLGAIIGALLIGVIDAIVPVDVF